MVLLENTYSTEEGYSPEIIADIDDMVNQFNEEILSDVAQKIVLLEKASILGNTQAMTDLAVIYMHGLHIEMNLTKALELFKKAAELGHACGMIGLAQYYFNHGNADEKNGVIGLCEEAIDLGNAEGYFWLYQADMNGIGTEKNEDTAIHWFAKAIQNNSVNAKLAAESCGLSSLYSEMKKDFNFL